MKNAEGFVPQRDIFVKRLRCFDQKIYAIYAAHFAAPDLVGALCFCGAIALSGVVLMLLFVNGCAADRLSCG